MFLAYRPPDAPLGFTLLGLFRQGLDQAFAQSPLTRFARLPITRQTRRRPRVSIDPRFDSSNSRIETQRSDKPTLLGFLHLFRS
jgi:hypothetical protein